MASWNHRIVRISDAPDVADEEWKRCSTRSCLHPYKYWAAYDYVTGRRGRVSWQRRLLCAIHTEKWCKKHRVLMTEIPTAKARECGVKGTPYAYARTES